MKAKRRGKEFDGLICVDKTPAFIIYAERLEKVFGKRCYFLITIRDPYPTIEGHMRRMRAEGHRLEDKDLLLNCVRHWINCAEIQKKNIKKLRKVVFYKYEELCDKSMSIEKKIKKMLPELDDLDFSREHHAPNLLEQKEIKIHNFNSPQINRLSALQRREITALLRRRKDLMKYFRYNFIS